VIYVWLILCLLQLRERARSLSPNRFRPRPRVYDPEEHDSYFLKEEEEEELAESPCRGRRLRGVSVGPHIKRF